MLTAGGGGGGGLLVEHIQRDQNGLMLRQQVRSVSHLSGCKADGSVLTLLVLMVKKTNSGERFQIQNLLYCHCLHKKRTHALEENL